MRGDEKKGRTDRRREQEDWRVTNQKLKIYLFSLERWHCGSFLLAANDTVHFFLLRKKKYKQVSSTNGWTKRAGMKNQNVTA